MSDNEIWKDVVGFEGQYQVSSKGRVRTLLFKNGRTCKRLSSPKLLRPWPGTKGYWRVRLGAKIYFTHRLVLEAFVGPAPCGHETAHLDGNRENSSLENLAWVTRKENHSHKSLHGTAQRGTNNPTAKLTESKVKKIKQLRRSGMKLNAIGKKFGVTGSTISGVCRGKSWTHV